MGQQHGRNVEIKLQKRAFGNTRFGPEDFAQIGQVNRLGAGLEIRAVDSWGNLPRRDCSGFCWPSGAMAARRMMIRRRLRSFCLCSFLPGGFAMASHRHCWYFRFAL